MANRWDDIDDNIKVQDAGGQIGNQEDQLGMERLGRKQELRRQFRFFGITGYAVILSCSWEFAMINIVTGLRNGGKAGSIWELVVAACGMFMVTNSFAEMASMAPTSGGQYHWVSEFAPRSVQKVLSYFVGIFCILGWQTSLAAVCYASAQQITALATIGTPGFSPTLWQVSLISFAVLAIAVATNTALLKKLPMVEKAAGVVHVLAFIAFVALLWATSNPNSARDVFTDFNSNDGWSNKGLAFLIGMTGPAAYFTTADSSVHLAEEVENVSYILPRSMIVTALSNYILSFVVVVTLVFSVHDLPVVSDSPLGQPYLSIIQMTTHSNGAATAAAIVTLILVVSCAINGLTTTSRLLWSFARDDALPFSKWISRVNKRLDIPLNAMILSIIFTVILNLIAIGSEVAYTILISLNVSGLLTSYIVCIACVLYRRVRGDHLPPSRWNLGFLGIPINVVALLFLTVLWAFQFFPVVQNPTLLEMNWGCVIYGVVCLASGIYFVLSARHRYTGPVVYINREVEQVLHTTTKTD